MANNAVSHCMCCCYQVFFCIVVAAFSIGTLAPNLANVGTARGAAYMIWELIDRVWAVMIIFGFSFFLPYRSEFAMLHVIVNGDNVSS